MIGQDTEGERIRHEIGWVGLGRMGLPMARRLLSAGHSVAVYNRSAESRDLLVRLGARPAANPGEVAVSGGVVFSMLLTEAIVQEACEGPRGMLDRLGGGTHVCMSTLSPAAAQRLLRLHEKAGVRFVLAPMQGRPAAAEAGELVAWVAGRDAASLEPLLHLLCRKIVWLGCDVRHAAVAKLALNMLMSANIALFAEAMAYVERHGVDREAFGGGLTGSAFSAPIFQAIVNALLVGDDAPKGSDIDLVIKDLSLILSDEPAAATLPLAAGALRLYEQAKERGWGERDASAVRRLYTALAVPKDEQ